MHRGLNHVDLGKRIQKVYIYIYILLRARRNEKDLKVKPATSFNYLQYLLTKN